MGRQGGDRAMKTIAVILMGVAGSVMTGCSVLGTTPHDESGVSIRPVSSEFDRARHGVITVSEVAPRSDIAVMPPSVEHVVWVRSSATTNGTWSEVVERTEETTMTGLKESDQTQRIRRTADEEYPLLRDHGAYDTEYGRVPMCLENGLLEPCEDAHLYDCYGSKGGGYCLERGGPR